MKTPVKTIGQFAILVACVLVPASLYFNATSLTLLRASGSLRKYGQDLESTVLKAIELDIPSKKRNDDSNRTHSPGAWHEEFDRNDPVDGHPLPKHITPKQSVEAHSILPPHSHTANVEPHPHGPRIVEVLMFGPAEVQMLILHMNTLEPVVDHFVVVESDITFQGKPKKMLFRTDVLPYLDKKLLENRIEYVELKRAFQKKHHNNAYHMERKSRNAGMAGLARLKLHDSDIIMVGDVDEIPAVSAVKHIWHTFDTEGHEESHFIILPAYRWSLHWVRQHADWIPAEDCPFNNGKPCQAGLPATAITTWGALVHLGDMATLHELYYERVEQSKPLYDRGWHCSSCMSYESIQAKYGAFALDDHRMNHYEKTHEILIQLIKGHHVDEKDPESFHECHQCVDGAPEFAKKHVHKFRDFAAMLSHPETDKRVSQVAAKLLYEGRHHHVIKELPLTKKQMEETQRLWDTLEKSGGLKTKGMVLKSRRAEFLNLTQSTSTVQDDGTLL